MFPKYWNNKFDIEWLLKYLLHDKLAKYPKKKENKIKADNIGYYFINKYVMKNDKCQTWKLTYNMYNLKIN